MANRISKSKTAGVNTTNKPNTSRKTASRSARKTTSKAVKKGKMDTRPETKTAATSAVPTSGDGPYGDSGAAPTVRVSPSSRAKLPTQRADAVLTPADRYKRNKELYPELYAAASEAMREKKKRTKTTLTARQFVRLRRRNRHAVKHSVGSNLSDESDAETSWHRKKLGITKKRKPRHQPTLPTSPPPVGSPMSALSAPLSDFALAALTTTPEAPNQDTLRPLGEDIQDQQAPPAPVRPKKGVRWSLAERQLILDIFAKKADCTIAAMCREWVAQMGGRRTLAAVNLEYQKHRAYYSIRVLPPPAVLQKGV